MNEIVQLKETNINKWIVVYKLSFIHDNNKTESEKNGKIDICGGKKWKMFKMNFTIKYEKYEQNEREMKKDEYWKGQLGKTRETLDYS